MFALKAGQRQEGPHALKIFSCCGIFFIQGAAGSHYGDQSAGTHLVQGFGDKIVMDRKLITVIPPVRHLISSKRNVADHDVEEVIGKRSALKSVNLDLSLGIEFLGDPTGEGVQFYAVQAAIVHPFGRQPKKFPVPQDGSSTFLWKILYWKVPDTSNGSQQAAYKRRLAWRLWPLHIPVASEGISAVRILWTIRLSGSKALESPPHPE